jgi:branched-chain amino acid transport system substrate-binding protein
MREILWLPLLLLAASAVAAPAPLPRDLVIGQVVDESGDMLEQSRDYVAGARVYFDSVNAQGGVAGRRIALVVKDGGGSAPRNATLARELIERDGAQVLFGNVGDAGVVALAKSGDLARLNMALFAPLAGIEIEGGSDNIFFLRPAYRAEAVRIVEWFGNIATRRAAVVRGGGDFAREAHDAVVARMRAVGIQLVADVELASDGRDAAAAAGKIAASDPSFVLVLADTVVAGQFIKALRALNPAVTVAGLSNIAHQTLLELAGPKLAYGTLLMQVVPDPFKGTSVVAREHIGLMKRFRDEPPSHATLEGFIAAKYLVAVLRSINGEIDRASILAALRARREVDVGGFVVSWPSRANRGSRYVDLTLLRKDGSLLH